MLVSLPFSDNVCGPKGRALLGKNCQRSSKEKNVSNNGDEINFFHWINLSPCLVIIVSNNGDEINIFHWINLSPCLVIFVQKIGTIVSSYYALKEGQACKRKRRKN